MNSPNPSGLKPLPSTLNAQSANPQTSSSSPPSNSNPQSAASSQNNPGPKLPPMLPPSVLLQGASGAGKSHVTWTWLAAGKKVFVVGTEPDFISSVLEACQKNNQPIDNLHWVSCLPSTEGFDALNEMTKNIGMMDFQALSALKGVGKDKTRQAATAFLSILNSFVCERDGIDYGSFTDWDDDCVLVIDSLSGLSIIAWYLTVGHKPTGAPGEWNIAMNWIEAILMKIGSDRKCYFVLNAHIEKEIDEISGINRVMTSTLGRKLAPKIPRFFSEVVYAKRRKTAPNFIWSTIDDTADLKNRSLPVAAELTPDFRPIVKSFDARKKLVATSVGTATSTT